MGQGLTEVRRHQRESRVKEYPEKPSIFNVLGVAVSRLNLETAREKVLQALSDGEKGYVCVTGVHGISEAQKDPAFRKILNRAYLNTPDGMPLVWLGKKQFGPDVSRVYGPDLMLEICSATEHTPYGHFFYGGGPGVAETLSLKLKERFPGLKTAGVFTPPFRPLNAKEEKDLVELLRKSRPAIFWVGLSTPKQEQFMAGYLDKLETTLMFGVGAAFDFHAGRVRQAPRWIQRSGFEWLYRLCLEPGRLWKRYLKNNPLFLFRLLLQSTGLIKYPVER